MPLIAVFCHGRCANSACPIIEQLADGGKLVIPVGSRMSQMLHVLTKQQGQLQTSTSCPCVFVRLIGQDGWEH